MNDNDAKTAIANWRERIMFPGFHSTEICFAVSYRIRAKGGLDLVKTASQCESPKSLFIISCNRIHYTAQNACCMSYLKVNYPWATYEDLRLCFSVPFHSAMLVSQLHCKNFRAPTSYLLSHSGYIYCMSGFNNRSEHSLKKTSGFMSSNFMIRMALKNN